MLMLIARRYERASLIVTSNKPFSAWGEIFGDDVVAAAMIDRLVHHAEILALKGDSYRLKDRDLARPPAARSAVSRPGFDGDLEARIASWQKGMLSIDGQTEEVSGGVDSARHPVGA